MGPGSSDAVTFSSKLRSRFTRFSITALFFVVAPLPYPIGDYARYADPKTFQVKVSTLNVWDLPWLSIYKTERTEELARAYKMRALDFAFMQEAWRKPYRDILARDSGMPYHNYFNERFSMGSGLMSLSSHAYDRVLFKPFMLNTVFAHLVEGETLSSKGVGVESIHIGGTPVSLFNLHTVARYTADHDGRADDQYTPERMMNLFEVFQHVVEQTDSDAFIVGGDFNSRAGTTEIRFWENLTSLDGIRAEELNPHFCTFCGDNSFHKDDQGQLDYIWVSPKLEFGEFHRDFDQKFDVSHGRAINISDHYGWQAVVGINQATRNITSAIVRQRTATSINELRARLEHYLWYWKGIEHITPPTPEGLNKICVVCRIKQSIEKVKIYQDALIQPSPRTQAGKLVKLRLDSYFRLFEQ